MDVEADEGAQEQGPLSPTPLVLDERIESQKRRAQNLWLNVKEGVDETVWNNVQGELSEGKVPPIFHSHVRQFVLVMKEKPPAKRRSLTA
jgi:hypothetical protein